MKRNNDIRMKNDSHDQFNQSQASAFYRSNLKMHLYPAFGDKRLDEITVETVQQFLNDRVDLAKNTVHTMFVLFSEIMDSAFEDRYIKSNPAKSKRINIPSTRKTERQALSPEQLRLIIAEISEKLTDDRGSRGRQGARA